jgi:hypothetical protein
MANKWRTTVAEADAKLVGYNVNPSDLSTEALTRKWTGVSRAVVYSLIATLRATKTVTDPKADGQTYSGIWTVSSVMPGADDGGNTAGSAEIIQVLKKSIDSYATSDNLVLVRSKAYPLEQNENAWMYYERFKSEETKRWHNITQAGLDDEVWDHIRQIRTYTAFAAAVTADADTYTVLTDTHQYHRKFLYVIFYNDTRTGSEGLYSAGAPAGGWVVGKYYTPGTATWSKQFDGSLFPYSWFFDDWVEIATPVIRDVWYEQNNDGSYNLFRSLETTSTTSLMRTRPLQYAGMTLVSGSPALDDTTITITGFINQTEVVHKNARFRIGSDTYRVTADKTASSGTATSIAITPAITQATEDLCDETPNQVQVFWDAL